MRMKRPRHSMRFEQMLNELFRGDVYMKMAYRLKN